MNKVDEFEARLEKEAVAEINEMIDEKDWDLRLNSKDLWCFFLHDNEMAYGYSKLNVLKSAIDIVRDQTQESVKEIYEIVDHPKHYGGIKAKHEAISVIEEWDLGFHLGNVVKYISRAGKKPNQDKISDLKKARWYLDRYISDLEADNVADSQE